ncbi:MAG TPA: ABC transporter ATP-binding protein, partial [Chloroflexi bacterium]|nr:ABC transporter ATP-binding protein [Chloroflexota bacterium]
MLRSLPRTFVIFKMYRGRLILSQVLLLISALCMIGVATLNQTLINNGIVAGDTEAIVRNGLWMAVLAVLAGVTMAGTAALAVFFAQGVAFGLRKYVYAKVQTFSFANFDRFRTGNLMVRLNADVNNVMNAILYMVLLTLYAPFMVLIAFILTFFFVPTMLWILIAVTVAVLGVMAVLIPQVVRAYEERQSRLSALNNTLQEDLAGIRVVKAFVREDYEIERFSKRADDMRQPAFAAAFRVALLNPILTAIAQIAIGVAVLVGGQQVLTNAGLQVGELVMFMQYLSLVVTPLAMMAIVVPFILRGDASAERIFEVYDAEPIVQDKEEARPLDPEKVQGRIAFENVSFAFTRPDGELDPPALKNINLTIEPGEKVGFLGATGAGKTALINLIPRFYDVTEGRITIDGIDVRDIAQDNLREIVGIALQEALLFQGDVRFNLKFGAPDVDDEVMQEAAKAADSYGFITNLPQQWDAPVARRGYNFSGGQRQRLSINRTLTPKPKILILDDSTSALDVATEARVQAAIPQFMPGTTILYVAQRISAVIDLDKIVLLQFGEIVDVG